MNPPLSKIRKSKKGYFRQDGTYVSGHKQTYYKGNRRNKRKKRKYTSNFRKKPTNLSEYLDQNVTLENFWKVMKSRFAKDVDISKLNDYGSIMYKFSTGEITEEEVKKQLSVLIKRDSKEGAKIALPIALNYVTGIPSPFLKPITNRIIDRI